MKKKNYSVVGQILLFILLIVMVINVCLHNAQSMNAILIPRTFIGEYSINGEEWKPYDSDMSFNSYEGDLVLRGHFDIDLPEEFILNLYLNHIGVTIFVDDEMVFMTGGTEILGSESFCGNQWTAWITPELTESNVIEIQLHNPHRYGNIEAYNEFLANMIGGPDYLLKNQLMHESLPWRVAGFIILILAIILLGVTLTSYILNVGNSVFLWGLSVLIFFSGGLIALDTIDVSLWSNLTIFNTHAYVICIMLSAFGLIKCIEATVKGRTKKIISYISLCAINIDIFLALLAFMKVMKFFDTLWYWSIANVVIFIIVLLCSIDALRTSTKRESISLYPFVGLLIITLVELINSYVGWWTIGKVAKIFFMILFVCYFLRFIVEIPNSYRLSLRAKKLEKDLQNSRIVLAVSQIRSHFMFNVLNAISAMCKSDAEKADEMIVKLSRYLRNNIDTISEDTPILFTTAMSHLQDYIELEQLRFGDKVKFLCDIETDEFVIPSLVLQPIVENAIKHGITRKKDGGTIRLTTRDEKKHVVITIEDDGVGFDTTAPMREDSVGLRNVRFRIENMINGTMNIESTVGTGTVVTIRIPKEEALG